MRSHVHQVAGPRRQGAQPLGVRQGQRRIAGDLGCVDVEVDRAGIVRAPLQHRLEHRHGAGQALAVVVVAPLAHPGVGGEDGDLVVVRIFHRQRVHRLGEGQIGGGVTGSIAWSGVAQLQRGDQRPVLRRLAPGQCNGLVRDRAGRLDLRCVDIVVQRRSQRPGLAPGAHGACRIDLRRPLERRLGVRVIEGVGQLHAIVEPGLGLRLAGRDRKAAGSDARDHHQPALTSRRRPVLFGRADEADGPGR